MRTTFFLYDPVETVKKFFYNIVVLNSQGKKTIAVVHCYSVHVLTDETSTKKGDEKPSTTLRW